VLQARLVVGIHAAGAGLGKITAAAVPAVAVAWGIGRWVDTWVDVVLFAGPLVAVVFLGTRVALRLDPVDLALVRSLVRRKAGRPRPVERRA
jgi:hypothetical protein